ncbi:MAG: DUF2062 domain-containing protein [Nitrospiraceae bacterium]|nr:MAG: DUF2062 domain-containing protein [Nitrospiraceae bacterium]
MTLRDRISHIFSIKETPHRISVAFALGVFVGMSPFLGVHTLLGIAFSYIFRLNKMVTLIGVYVTNPWTIIPIYTFGTWTGTKLLGINEVLPEIDWAHISFLGLMEKFSHLVKPFVVGTMSIGTVAALISYILIFNAVKKAHENSSDR